MATGQLNQSINFLSYGPSLRLCGTLQNLSGLLNSTASTSSF
jgi:hypothetical protein